MRLGFPYWDRFRNQCLCRVRYFKEAPVTLIFSTGKKMVTQYYHCKKQCLLPHQVVQLGNLQHTEIIGGSGMRTESGPPEKRRRDDLISLGLNRQDCLDLRGKLGGEDQEF